MTAEQQPPKVQTDRSAPAALPEIGVFKPPAPALGYWDLVWIRLRRHRSAFVSLWILAGAYLVCVVLAEFFAPFSITTYSSQNIAAPPQWPRLIDQSGHWSGQLFVYGLTSQVDQSTGKRTHTINTAEIIKLCFVCRGEAYKLWGLIETDWHLFVPVDGYAYILGGDRLGRDLLSRIIFGGRVTLTVSLVGLATSMFLGVFLGTVSGYFGGTIDVVIQRATEILLSFPAIPLWLTLSAALPTNWTSIQVYFAITTLLGLINWAWLARQIRGQVLVLREQSFIQASQALGAGHLHIIFRHLIPNLTSHMIVIGTLTIPWMILSETALSFLGLGIRPPLTSWGVLLEEAQNVQALRTTPWLVFPALAVILTVMAFNFLGDGLRDATEPRPYTMIETAEP